MTPVESMKETVVNAVDTALRITKQILADGYTYNSPEAFVAELRSRGFTVVPVEPTDETVEAMARALSEGQGFYDSYDFDNGLIPIEVAESFRNYARAAYAAAVKGTRYD